MKALLFSKTSTPFDLIVIGIASVWVGNNNLLAAIIIIFVGSIINWWVNND